MRVARAGSESLLLRRARAISRRLEFKQFPACGRGMPFELKTQRLKSRCFISSVTFALNSRKARAVSSNAASQSPGRQEPRDCARPFPVWLCN